MNSMNAHIRNYCIATPQQTVSCPHYIIRLSYISQMVVLAALIKLFKILYCMRQRSHGNWHYDLYDRILLLCYKPPCNLLTFHTGVCKVSVVFVC